MQKKHMEQWFIKLNLAICAAPVHLAKADILEGKKYTTTLPVHQFKEFEESNYQDEVVVIDINNITAKGCGYVEFAMELSKKMDIFKQ